MEKQLSNSVIIDTIRDYENQIEHFQKRIISCIFQLDKLPDNPAIYLSMGLCTQVLGKELVQTSKKTDQIFRALVQVDLQKEEIRQNILHIIKFYHDQIAKSFRIFICFQLLQDKEFDLLNIIYRNNDSVNVGVIKAREKYNYSERQIWRLRNHALEKIREKYNAPYDTEILIKKYFFENNK